MPVSMPSRGTAFRGLARGTWRVAHSSTGRQVASPFPRLPCPPYTGPLVLMVRKQSICCAVGTACYATDLSPSGIYCCGNSSDCAAGPPREAVCLLGTTQCGAELGGGCCANAMDCSQDGCRIDQPQPSATDDSSMPEDTATSEATGSVTNKLGEVAPPNGGARWLATPSDATVAVLGAAWAAVVLL